MVQLAVDCGHKRLVSPIGAEYVGNTGPDKLRSGGPAGAADREYLHPTVPAAVPTFQLRTDLAEFGCVPDTWRNDCRHFSRVTDTPENVQAAVLLDICWCV